MTSTVQTIDGEPSVSPFTGTFNGSPVSITFSVGLGGENPTMVSSDIPGHPNATFDLYKETSTSLIEAFEGRYTVADGKSGVFNIVLSRGLMKWGAVSKSDQTGEVNSDISGTIENGDQLKVPDETFVVGTLNGDVLYGNFVGSDNQLTTITGQRTL